MNISLKKKQEIYNVINKPIIDLRILLKKDKPTRLAASEEIDLLLFELRKEIWLEVQEVLKSKQRL